MSLINVKKAIRNYTKNLLTTQYPSNFNDVNIAWTKTDDNRNDDPNRTECFLAVTSDDSYGFSVDREFYLDEDITTTADNYKTRQVEIHTLTVMFGVSSMSKQGELTPLQAENLAYEACSYIRKNLKTLASSNYFLYDNSYFAPIHVLSNDISSVDDVSEFEDTKYRYTFQFSCKFRFDEVGSAITPLAENSSVEISGEDVDIEFDIVD